MRKMKDSGIPWVGEIPKEWEVGRIKDYTDIVMGQSPDGDCISSEPIGYPFMQGNAEFTDKYPKPIHYCSNPNKISREGDILMSVRAPVGALNLSDKVYGIGRGLCSIKSVNINQDYLWYYLKKSSVDFDYFGNGSTFSAITVSSLNNFPLVYPTLAEQQKIAEFLDRKCAEVDEMIGLQEQIIEELKAYKQSVITEAVTKGLNPDAPMKDSGIEWIGEIPEHWEVCRVKDCLQNTKNNLRVGPFGSALSGNDICDTGEYWIYNQRTVLDSNFSTNNSFVTKEKFNELESFKVFPNDILITTRGSIGKIAIVPPNAPIGILHPCIIRFVIDESKYNSRLLKRIFNESDFVLKQLRYQSNSTTIEVIYSYTLRNITLPNIPIDEQQAIADYLDEKCADIDSLIQSKQEKIESLKEYKKSIIYEYVTGKREVE